MMSIESIFSLLFCTGLLAFLSITFSAYNYDTVLYEYQVANDFAETVYQSGCGYFTSDFEKVIDSLHRSSGYCISASGDGQEYTASGCPSVPDDRNLIVVRRSMPGIGSGQIAYSVWKSS